MLVCSVALQRYTLFYSCTLEPFKELNFGAQRGMKLAHKLCENSANIAELQTCPCALSSTAVTNAVTLVAPILFRSHFYVRSQPVKPLFFAVEKSLSTNMTCFHNKCGEHFLLPSYIASSFNRKVVVVNSI